MDPKKVSTISNLPIPKNVKDVQSFIGLANYCCCFIAGFAIIARSFHKLLRNNVHFKWSSET